jgi:hypothetical protein
MLLAFLGAGRAAFRTSFAHGVLVFMLAAFFFAIEAAGVSDLCQTGQVIRIRSSEPRDSKTNAAAH